MVTVDGDEWQPVYAPANTHTSTMDNSTKNGHRRRGFQNHDTGDPWFLPIYEGTHPNGFDDDARQPDKRSYWNRVKEAIFLGPLVIRGRLRAGTANIWNSCSSNDEQSSTAVERAGRLCSPIDHSVQDNSYYEDTYNGESWACSFGTDEDVCVFGNGRWRSCAFIHPCSSISLCLCFHAERDLAQCI